MPNIALGRSTKRQRYPNASKTLRALGPQFVLSTGIAECQLKQCENTLDPKFVKKSLTLAANKAAAETKSKGANADQAYANFLTDKDRKEYTAQFLYNQTPPFGKDFDEKYEQAFLDQVADLNASEQPACKEYNASNIRYDLELSQILSQSEKTGTIQVDETKLSKASDFLQKIGNPFLFFHHYTNPLVKPHLFEDEQDSALFADWCKQVIEKNQHITHVCPMSQVMGYAMRMEKQKSLPPFDCTVDRKTLLKNVTDANILACKAIKAANPQVKTYISHQWKPFKTLHTSKADPRYYLEKLICAVADQMYNQTFVAQFKKEEEHFDGIALSIYPSCYFDIKTPIQDNCSGTLDPEGALEAILETSKAFPGKEIYITETGCDSDDPQVRKAFIDMTLEACKKAQDLGILIKGCYLWGHTNDPNFYYEWNATPGTSKFGFYDKLDLSNPIESINPAGIYLKEVLKSIQ